MVIITDGILDIIQLNSKKDYRLAILESIINSEIEGIKKISPENMLQFNICPPEQIGFIAENIVKNITKQMGNLAKPISAIAILTYTVDEKNAMSCIVDNSIDDSSFKKIKGIPPESYVCSIVYIDFGDNVGWYVVGPLESSKLAAYEKVLFEEELGYPLD